MTVVPIKMHDHIFLFFIVLFVFSCKTETQSSQLRKLTYEELTDWFIKDKFVNDSTILRDTLGNILDKSILHSATPDQYFVDYYVDDKNILREAVLRKATTEDKLFFDQVLILKTASISSINYIDVNCDSITVYLNEAYKKDQNPKLSGVPDLHSDRDNLDLVMNILKDCGMPTTKQDVVSVFLVIQHSNIEIMEQLFSQFQEAVMNGLLEPKTLALMEDRILLHRTGKQKYGTQYQRTSLGVTILPVSDSLNVDIRRAKIGLGTLREYLYDLNN